MTAAVTMPDGRTLAYEEYGDPEGTPVLSFHGGLSSRLDAEPAHNAALGLGVRVISPDRPGMGLSTYQPGRTLLDWPRDVTRLVDTLGIDRFAVMGWSCGGAYAAACGATMPERVTAIALLSSAVPLDVFGTTRGLARDDRLLLWLVRHLAPVASLVMWLAIERASDRRLYEEIRRTFPAPDRAALEERGSPHTAVAFVKESMRQGTRGCLQDYRIFGAPWGFALEDVAVPVHMWEGTEDHTGPPGYNQLLLERLPDARLTRVPGEGHVSLLGHQAPAILAALLDPEART
ncbi:MAG TPA: alpha/beta hydrolase [Acidimicrobiales bacterium]|nr:alpha/beta hydrolase [Acidimicrobiales bacterium]